MAQAVTVENSGNAAEVVANEDNSHDLAQVGASCQKSQVVAGLGFEPRQTDSESVVLPLHNPAVDAPAAFSATSKSYYNGRNLRVKFFRLHTGQTNAMIAPCDILRSRFAGATPAC